LALGLGYLLSGPDYRLTPQSRLLLSTANATLTHEISYSTKSQAFVINKSGMEQQPASSPNVLVGQPATGLYSATLPTDLARGITVTNNSGHISFTLQPEFKAAPAKLESGHFVYPLADGMQLIYTAQADQLAEDIILNHPVANTRTCAFQRAYTVQPQPRGR
jgi:hypothetical protein